VSKHEDIKRLLSETVKAFGRLDILVNNAGVYELAPLEKVSEELFHRHFNLNVLGLLLTTQEAVKRMGPQGGSIINIGSTASSMQPPDSTVYTATKAAVDAITGVLAKELGPRHIRVNSINPGMIETEGVHAAGFAGSDFQKMVETQAPLGRIGQPDDIAPTAVYLASSDSKYMTGETLGVPGGLRWSGRHAPGGSLPLAPAALRSSRGAPAGAGRRRPDLREHPTGPLGGRREPGR